MSQMSRMRGVRRNSPILDWFEILVMWHLLHGDQGSGRAMVPPEVGGRIDQVEDTFLAGLVKLRQDMPTDVVGGTQAAKAGAQNTSEL